MERIKALLNFVRIAPTLLFIKALNVFTHLNGNPAYPNPPVDLNLFKSEIDRLEILNAEVIDGSKSAFAAQKRQVQVVVGMMRDLAYYVEPACKGNRATFLSSGFD